MSERYYQSEAADAALNYFATGGRGNPLILMPTGTGKSWVLAGMALRIMQAWPNQRLLMATMAKELVEQNAEKLRLAWPGAPLGVCSAALNQYNTGAPIVYGTPGTLINRVGALGHRDVFFVDEAQNVSPEEETQLRQLIAELRKINPYMPVIGLTATGFRTRTGLLTNKGGLFTDVVYDITQRDAYNRLVAEGFLSPLITVRTNTHIDVSNVHLQGGDFKTKEVSELMHKQQLIDAALDEFVQDGDDRVAWMLFAPSIDDVSYCVDVLSQCGVPAVGVHSKMRGTAVDSNVAAYKHGDARCLVVANKLTVGFDHPPIDYIGCLRPTMSPGWWIQATGRGARPSPETGKTNCLVKDFTGNTRRVGPINDPYIARPGGKKTGEAPIRICDECHMYNHASARFCGGTSKLSPEFKGDTGCGVEFPRVYRISETADFTPIVVTNDPVYAWYDVSRVLYTLHEKDGSPPSMRVTYLCGSEQVSEWVPFEHPTGKMRARSWWLKRTTEFSIPSTTAEALAHQMQLRQPKRIQVRTDTRFPEVANYEY